MEWEAIAQRKSQHKVINPLGAKHYEMIPHAVSIFSAFISIYIHSPIHTTRWQQPCLQQSRFHCDYARAHKLGAVYIELSFLFAVGLSYFRQKLDRGSTFYPRPTVA